MVMGAASGGLTPWGLQLHLWVEVLPTFSWKTVKIDVGLVFLSRSPDALALFPACTEHSTRRAHGIHTEGTWRLSGAHMGTEHTVHAGHTQCTEHTEHTAYSTRRTWLTHCTHGAHSTHRTRSTWLTVHTSTWGHSTHGAHMHTHGAHSTHGAHCLAGAGLIPAHRVLAPRQLWIFTDEEFVLPL